MIVLREVNAEKLKEQEVTENISCCSGEPELSWRAEGGICQVTEGPVLLI